MSDLEDDVLMAYIKQGQELLALKETNGRLEKRERLQKNAWAAFDHLLRVLLASGSIHKEAQLEVDQLKKALRAIIEFDEREKQ